MAPDAKGDESKFKVSIVTGEHDRRALRLSELQGLNLLSSPAWVFDQQKRRVPWANVEARKAYFKRLSEDRRASSEYAEVGGVAVADADCDDDCDDSSAPRSDTVRLYAMAEKDGCTVHIVGPRRVLLAGMRATAELDDSIVTLVVSPIDILEGSSHVPKRATLFQEIGLSEMRFDRTMDIKANDTPMDVIMKMLDEVAAGFPVPAVHAKVIRAISSFPSTRKRAAGARGTGSRDGRPRRPRWRRRSSCRASRGAPAPPGPRTE